MLEVWVWMWKNVWVVVDKMNKIDYLPFKNMKNSLIDYKIIHHKIQDIHSVDEKIARFVADYAWNVYFVLNSVENNFISHSHKRDEMLKVFNQVIEGILSMDSREIVNELYQKLNEEDMEISFHEKIQILKETFIY